MLKLLVFTTLLALATSDGLEKFEGDWTVVRVYPDLPISEDCDVFKIETSSEHCKCGKNKQTPVIKSISSAGTVRIPVIGVETKEEIEGALRKKCTCKAKGIGTFHMVFRYLNDNYFHAYNSEVGDMFTVLFAKEVLSTKEIDDFAQTVDVLKDQTWTAICSKDAKSGNKKASTNTTATTHWMNWRPTAVKTDTASETNNS